MNEHSIQLLCLDIDGTLLDSAHRLPPENRAAVREAVRSGVTVCLMSARPPGAILPILRELELENEMACYNGGVIYYRGQKIYEERIPVQVGMQIYMEAKRCGIHLSTYRDWDWLIDENDCWSRQESDITGLTPITLPIQREMSQWNDGAHKFLCMGEPYRIDEVFSGLEARRLPVQLVRSKDTYLEILPLTAEKGVALQTLCRVLGIAQNRAMAIGDHDNDCGMLRAAGCGIAMGNGSEAAKQAAMYQTRSNDEAGVAYAIERWILNRRECDEAQ